MRSRLADKTYLQYIYNQIYSVSLEKSKKNQQINAIETEI